MAKSTLAERNCLAVHRVVGKAARCGAQYNWNRMEDIERGGGSADITIKSQAVPAFPWASGRLPVRAHLIDNPPGHTSTQLRGLPQPGRPAEGRRAASSTPAQGHRGAERLAKTCTLAAGRRPQRIIPVLNKIDCPAAQPGPLRAAELAGIIRLRPPLRCSASLGEDRPRESEHLLHEIVRLIPGPRRQPGRPGPGPLIFDLDLRHPTRGGRPPT